MRVVLDTSVLAAAFLRPREVNAKVLRYGEGRYELYPDAILDELRRVPLTYDRIRKRYPYSDKDVHDFIESLKEVAHVVSNCPQVNVIKEDPDDNIVIACALKASADLIVSKDHHLRELGSYKGIRIVSSDEFLAMLEGKLGGGNVCGSA